MALGYIIMLEILDRHINTRLAHALYITCIHKYFASDTRKIKWFDFVILIPTNKNNISFQSKFRKYKYCFQAGLSDKQVEQTEQ